MDKSLLTNLVAAGLVAAGLLINGDYQYLVLSTGLFALSGALTNWLAVHMLFEKVPGFYGSGVIPSRFEEFKAGIKSLVMEQFFNTENIQRFFSQKGAADTPEGESFMDAIIDKVDLDGAFEALVDVILKSTFGSMLAMLGGAKALRPLKEPFIRRMREYLGSIGDDELLMDQIMQSSSASLAAKIEHIVEQRLDELTPQLVKEIIQEMIREHLGWLVVWGGVIGGLIGLLVSLLL